MYGACLSIWWARALLLWFVCHKCTCRLHLHLYQQLWEGDYASYVLTFREVGAIVARTPWWLCNKKSQELKWTKKFQGSFWSLGLKNWGPSFFFFMAWFGFCNIFPVLKWANICKGHWVLDLDIFWALTKCFRAVGLRARLISSPEKFLKWMGLKSIEDMVW